MAGESILGGIAAINPVLDYLRPRRSPYLIPASVSAILLARYIGDSDGYRSDSLDLNTALFIGPIVLIFGIFVFLCIRYRDPSLDDIPEEDADKIQEEIDSQLKFARATGIAIGAFGIYYLFLHEIALSALSVLGYVLCLLHLATFIVYMALYNYRSEGVQRHSLFQIGALMSTSVIVLVFSVPEVSSEDGDLLLNCRTVYTFEYEGRKKREPNVNDFGIEIGPTAEEIESIPLTRGTYDLESTDCEPVAPAPSLATAGVHEEGYSTLGPPVQGMTERFLDAHVTIFAAFAAFWLYLEAFWVRLLLEGIRRSLNVLDASPVGREPPSRRRRA